MARYESHFYGADMESKRHQKLYEHYTNYFGQEPKFSLKLKKNVLSEAFKSSKIVKCYISEHKYISIFQVMPITRVAIQEAQKGHERRLLVYGIFLHAR